MFLALSPSLSLSRSLSLSLALSILSIFSNRARPPPLFTLIPAPRDTKITMPTYRHERTQTRTNHANQAKAAKATKAAKGAKGAKGTKRDKASDDIECIENTYDALLTSRSSRMYL